MNVEEVSIGTYKSFYWGIEWKDGTMAHEVHMTKETAQEAIEAHDWFIKLQGWKKNTGKIIKVYLVDK